MAPNLDAGLLDRFVSIVGEQGICTDQKALEPALTEWRGLYRGTAPALIAPKTAAEASAILSICNEHRIGVVPQGGNTGLAGGAIAHDCESRREIIISTRRLNRILSIDTDNYTITAEAGCVLSDVQSAAAQAERLFPLSLAAEGSCQLGGNISTNAGGTNVLRYGNTRDLVLGLQVVLADGRIFDGLKGLRKDNTGYDLKQCFIGAEGTLGLITAATCKLFPLPASTATAWVSVAGPDAAVRLLSLSRKNLGDNLNAFELMNRESIDLVLRHIPDTRNPLSDDATWTVLLELGSSQPGTAAADQLEAFLVAAIEQQLVIDGAVASSVAQQQNFWRLRHSISEAQKLDGASIKHDISVPVSRVGDFIERASAAMRKRVSGIKVVAFGHLGDGNIHFNLNQPARSDREAFVARWDELASEVHDIAVSMGGSFSAEHGIGALKVAELTRLSDPVALALMAQIKQSLDPNAIMNPGKLLA